jgi:hypothetical protein
MKSTPYFPYSPSYKYSFDIPKEEWKRFKPRRFIYHLTKGDCPGNETEENYYKRLNVVFNGLLGNDNGISGVWANNQIEDLFLLYPFILDGIGLSDRDYIEFAECFDVWRIDTYAINSTWYLDPNFSITHHELIENWVFTERSIPSCALKLFKFDFSETSFNSDRFDPIIKLKPVNEINRLLLHQNLRKTMFTQ